MLRVYMYVVTKQKLSGNLLQYSNKTIDERNFHMHQIAVKTYKIAFKTVHFQEYNVTNVKYAIKQVSAGVAAG